MKWTPILIDWDTSDRTQMDYTQDTTMPVNTLANTEGMTTGEADPSMGAETESLERLVTFDKVISKAHRECMEIETDLKLVPEYSNFQHYLAYTYKASIPGTHCYCNRCLGFLEMAHCNVIKTRNILYSKLVTLAKNNLQYRERYSTIYHQLTGFSVKFSDMPFDLPIIDNSCYDYQLPSPLVLGICHFRRRYEKLEACHVKIVQTKNTLRQQIDTMRVMNKDLLEKCDKLFAMMQKKLSANSETFDENYEYDPEDSCPCRHNCSDCKEMMEGRSKALYRERYEFNTECETTMEEYTELEDKYKGLVARVTNSSRFRVFSGPHDAQEQYEDYVFLRSETNESIIEQYGDSQSYQDADSDSPRDRCGSCSHCALELKLIDTAKVNRIFRELFKFKQQYRDLFEEYSNFRNRVIGD
ncbi:uncharacterized protein EAF01_008234 [Botrytis porri]|uniref:Uncharacterized protein n=1 Tax=Botrytis porri TaxID=87229 RepID=A0A4Z1L6Q0_9HELO|nr:uncharacterized protein EAF01_008234 [Botrytis porri]KAF7899021.1 hypothetical protein EAF01_008234 [Botrytis porri]TGO92540.1 hypothetical protein BPOR_0001g00250 [Botrytis porri]